MLLSVLKDTLLVMHMVQFFIMVEQQEGDDRDEEKHSTPHLNNNTQHDHDY
jgi:hypothetical protein